MLVMITFLGWLMAAVFALAVYFLAGEHWSRSSAEAAAPERLPLAVTPIDATVLRRSRERVNRALGAQPGAGGFPTLRCDLLDTPEGRAAERALRLAKNLNDGRTEQVTTLENLWKLD